MKTNGNPSVTRRTIALVTIVSLLTACDSPSEPVTEVADIVLTNGKFLTMDNDFSTAEAMAIKDDRIMFVGSQGKVLELRGPDTRVIDLEGRTATPGIIDSHMHFAQLGRRIHQLFLTDTNSAAEVVDLVRAKAETSVPGDWITGDGWHTAAWGGAGYPDGDALNEAMPANPVFLRGMSWHAAWVNDVVLDMAGITRDTPDPVGGKIVRDSETGEPTGVLLETATKLVEAVLPQESRDDLKAIIKASNEAALAMGITTVHDAMANDKEIALYREMIANGDLNVRMYLMYHVDEFSTAFDEMLEHAPEIGSGNNHLTQRTFKIFSDGALGARGAALLERYSDDESSVGLLRNSGAEIDQIVGKIMNAGYQVAYHAIGDRANRLVLDAIENTQLRYSLEDARPRIEHAQILSMQDLPRFGKLGVIASMQPLHFSLDMAFAEARLGRKRMQGAYAWRSLIDSGATIVANADAPFSPVRHSDPLIGIYAAVTRRSLEGVSFGEDYSAQRVTRREAIEMYTVNAAYAGFEEDLKGSLVPGKLADITVWSKDISAIEAEELLATKVVMTMIGGDIVYDPNGLLTN